MESKIEEMKKAILKPENIEFARIQFLESFGQEPTDNELFHYMCGVAASMMAK